MITTPEIIIFCIFSGIVLFGFYAQGRVDGAKSQHKINKESPRNLIWEIESDLEEKLRRSIENQKKQPITNQPTKK